LTALPGGLAREPPPLTRAGPGPLQVADSKIHLLGSFSNIKIARDAICDLILGSAPGKVYTKLRAIASRLKERF
jgi:rRNA processing protein Krr1/Pno1